jgi:hypothetical protein
MPRRPTFPRRADLIRGVKAARDAGIPNPCVIIDSQNRTMTIKASGEPVKNGGTAPTDTPESIIEQL